MPQKHPKSKSRSTQFGAYKAANRYAVNKRTKLERHMKNFPNDEVAQAALAALSSTSPPKRGTPKSRVWSAAARDLAQMFALVGINGHHALENPKISARIDDGEHKRFDGGPLVMGEKKQKKAN